jgi:hypothetical protein
VLLHSQDGLLKADDGKAIESYISGKAPEGEPGRQLKNLTALYTKEEKRNTPPYSIAREKFTAMQKRNLLLREKPTKASQTLNEEVPHEQNRA